MGMNLIEKLGLEKCRAIVEGAPDTAICINQEHNYFKNIRHPCCEMWNPYDQVWFETGVFSFDEFYALKDLRTAIADHDRTDHCSDIRNHVSPNTKVSER